MENESMEEGTAAPAEDTLAIDQSRGLTHWIVNILYMGFNGACMIVYGYQIYFRVKQGAWNNIPSSLLLPPGTEPLLVAQAGGMGKAVGWLLNVELSYTLCVIAMLFYGVRCWIDRQSK
jgi:hypothetical protein